MSNSSKTQTRKAVGKKSERKTYRSAAKKSEHKSRPPRVATGAKKRAARDASKLSAVIAMLRRPDGASIKDLCKATGWQAHSVRGALSGAIKKRLGLAVTSEKSDGVRVYRVIG